MLMQSDRTATHSMKLAIPKSRRPELGKQKPAARANSYLCVHELTRQDKLPVSKVPTVQRKQVRVVATIERLARSIRLSKNRSLLVPQMSVSVRRLNTARKSG